MARRSRSSSRSRGRKSLRLFVVANLVVWGFLGTWFLFQPPARQEEVSRLVGNLFDSRKRITAFDVARDLWQLYGRRDFVRVPLTGDRAYCLAGFPRADGLNGTVRVLENIGYVVGYSDALGDPLWAAYQVRDQQLEEPPPRPDAFVVDLRTVARVEPSVYNRSGYDRGHMAPNYAIATRYGQKAQEETFRMSNICPQRHALNAGIWKELEHRIATNYAGRFGEVWVLAGPVFGARPERLQRRVAVPEGFFMIVTDESDGRVRAEAFLFPQDTPPDASLDRYLVSIDEIERRTGLDFFPELPGGTQATLEERAIARAW
jgi:endonuclease G